MVLLRVSSAAGRKSRIYLMNGRHSKNQEAKQGRAEKVANIEVENVAAQGKMGQLLG